MIEILYISDTEKQSQKFIYELISDLKRIGVKNINHDREHNLITFGNMEIRGMTIYEDYISHGMRNIKYFIDGIDMKNYKNASGRQLGSLVRRIKEIISHFNRDTKQLSGKDELIKILTENNAEVAE